MKNNFYNFIFIILILLFNNNLVNSNELTIKALKINVLDEGNVIIGSGKAEAISTNGLKIYADQFKFIKNEGLLFANGSAKAISNNELEIYAKEFKYNETKKLLIASGNVKVFDLINEINLNSESVHYNELVQNITSFGNTEVNVKNKYDIKTKNLDYDIIKKELSSNFFTKIKDTFENNIELDQFKYFFNKELVKGKKIRLLDSEGNEYFLNEGVIKLEGNLFSGKDIKINFTNEGFEIPEGEPRLSGNSIFYENQKTLIQKGTFTSCKKNNDECPPWHITSKEITHDKSKKQINYKNAWLKIYDVPVLYFPRFFHPDPSVKRQSGFLQPKFGDSRKLGESFSLPYFHVISDSSDLTFRPRIFSENEYLLRSEYRKVTKNSLSILDFSVNTDTDYSRNGRKTHFFLNTLTDLDLASLDNSSLDLKFEKTSNDSFLKTYSLEDNESIVNNTDILESFVNFSAEKNEFFIDLSFEAYETLGLANSNRHEFVYPNYTLYKNIDLDKYFFQNLDFVSSGNQRTHTTNIYEAVQVNDARLSSKKFISKNGLQGQFTNLLKNVNSEGKNSSKFKTEGQMEVLNITSYDLSLPLRKNSQKFYEYITPKISARHSPNSTTNIKDKNHSLNASNIFDLNRIGTNETIEGGSTLTFGATYQKENLDYENILSISAANVVRDKSNDNLSINSTLGKKQSDIVGNIYYSPISSFNIDYNYSLDNDIKTVNKHSITNEISTNNFVNTFNFYEENNILGKRSYYSNTFKYLADENNSFSFATRRNKENNLTEFYDLIYQYQNDCLTASIQYNKEFYSGGINEPFEQLFFNITLMPLGGTSSENLMNLKPEKK